MPMAQCGQKFGSYTKMAFDRPTLSTLVGRVITDIESELQNGASLIRRTFERAVGVAIAGISHGLHGHIEWAARQLFPDRADDEFAVVWSDIHLGVNSRKPATKAELQIEIIGTVGGTIIPEGTTWVRSDGVRFESISEDSIPASAPYELILDVIAIEAGSDGNTIPGTVLSMESGIENVEPDSIVQGSGSDPIGGGADIERIIDLIARLLDQLQNPPKAGGTGDYVRWAKQVSGVTRVWELPRHLGPSTVLVLFVADVFDVDGFYESTTFPDSTFSTTVKEYIEQFSNVTAIVTAQAPVEVTLDPEIEIEPNTIDMRNAVSAQLNDLLLRQDGPSATGSTVYLWQVIQAISLTPNLTNHVLISPTANVDLAATELLTLGTPVYSDIT